MAIVLNNKRISIKLDTKTIIGVMGDNYDLFLSSLSSNDIFYLDKSVSLSSRKVHNLVDVNNSKVINLLKEYHLGEKFINKSVSELSHSEKKLLKYLLLVSSDKKIIIIDEPFMDLDYDNKKKISLLINKLIKENKTIIIGSVDSNIIYSICKKVLLINKDSYYYGDIDSFQDQKLLKKYHIDIPDLVKYVSLIREKKIKMRYSYDIRDLIKDVYRNVS